MRVLVSRIDTYCDVCRHDGRETLTEELDAILFEIAGKPKRVDVCAEHDNPTWQVIANVAVDDIDPERQTPRAQGRASSQSASIVCPIRSCGKTAITIQGLSTHLAKTHKQLTQSERWDVMRPAMESLGNVSPTMTKRLRANTECPVKGCNKLVAGAQGARMHMSLSHHDIDASAREKLIAAL